ncbi:MAG TPA: ABC transporter permease subunit [Acidimicrobiales bacterium]|nr:ABC transporter permease subunit [Acidimicrobiales bacterium]
MLGVANPWTDWQWVGQHGGEITSAVVQHVELTVIAVGIGLALSLPLALLVWRWSRWETPVYGLTGLLFAIPSLALFAFLIPLTGLTRLTAEIALVSYTLLILIRNIVTGLRGVPPDVRDAAVGLGYSPLRRLAKVDLPLALPTIVAGIRVAVVTTIGLVAIAGYIGAGGGIGALIDQGQIEDFRAEVALGAVLSVLLALAFDLALVGLQRVLTPWARRGVG